MRLRRRDLKTYTFKQWQKVTEADGTTYDGWGDSGMIQANVQPAGGRMLIEMYGARLSYMKVAYLESLTDSDGIISLTEGDGVYIDREATNDVDPDYKIVAIRSWNTYYVIDLEKVRT